MASTIGCEKKPNDNFSEFLAQPHVTVPAKYLTCASMVNNYVATQKKWPESDYKISFDGLDSETGYQVFRITHKDLYEGTIGIGKVGSSFFLYVDCADMRIEREYLEQ